MKLEDIKVGMKVVPHGKSVEGFKSLENSMIWGRAIVKKPKLLICRRY